MNEKNDFAVVRRPSSAVEKAAPGAKRILSGMVADALVMARDVSPLDVVMVDHQDCLLKILKSFICTKFTNVNVRIFLDAPNAFHDLLRRDPDVLITAGVLPQIQMKEVVRYLFEKKNVPYPIIVMAAHLPVEQWVKSLSNQGRRITYLKRPFHLEEFCAEVSKSLKRPPQSSNYS